MTDKITPIRIEAAALDDEGDRVILRGVVALESLPHLRIDDYQREELTTKQRSSILKALEEGEPLPDFELGMRSEKYTSPKPGEVLLKDFVYIIDGFQRRTTIMEYLAQHPDAKVRVGVKIYFDSTKEWERDRFHVLNAKRSKVSPNVLLRNMRDDSNAVTMLWGLTKNEKAFVLCDRVCWSQQMARSELLTALTFAKAVGMLHSHKGPNSDNYLERVVLGLDKTLEEVGVQAMRENARAFFGLVDECWGIRRVHYHNRTPYLKASFLSVFAKLLSDHYAFWKDEAEKHLFVEASLRRKIAQFPINDPEVVRLSGAGGKAKEMLYMLLRDHINSGKRTKRITSRFGDAIYLAPVEDEEEVVEDKAAA